jgi:hypothetical protein
MRRFIGVLAVAVLIAGVGNMARAEDDAGKLVAKAIKALGGEEKLGAVKAVTWKVKGTVAFGGTDNELVTTTTLQGLDHLRREFEVDINGVKMKGATVVAGDKGWSKFGEMDSELDKERYANEKRAIYLDLIPITLVQLKDKGFKLEPAGEEKVGDKPAVGLKVTGPDGKEFKIYFDKESDLPVKVVADKVMGFDGSEYKQETTFSNYKDFDGIKKATKAAVTKDGEKLFNFEVTEFKVLDKVDPKTFEQPK